MNLKCDMCSNRFTVPLRSSTCHSLTLSDFQFGAFLRNAKPTYYTHLCARLLVRFLSNICINLKHAKHAQRCDAVAYS